MGNVSDKRPDIVKLLADDGLPDAVWPIPRHAIRPGDIVVRNQGVLVAHWRAFSDAAWSTESLGDMRGEHWRAYGVSRETLLNGRAMSRPEPNSETVYEVLQAERFEMSHEYGAVALCNCPFVIRCRART